MELPPLQEAAKLIYQRGWLPIPLGYDANGFPKVPILKEWTQLDHESEDISTYPWGAAKGLGIVLGLPSNRLCVVDIDSEPLFNACLESMGDKAPRSVRTARNRGHMYFYEQELSLSSKRTYVYRGQDVGIELKSNGTQVAAPPSPGYSLIKTGVEPVTVSSIASGWSWIMDCLNRHGHEITLKTLPDGGANRFPSPWQRNVPAGERNDTCYVEAHRLREAGMSQEIALDLMRGRWEQHYEAGQDWSEIENTVLSAYKKGALAQKDSYDYHLF